MPEFEIFVEYSDSHRPGERLGKTVTVEADDEFQAKARGGVEAIFTDAHKLYRGNIASFSDVNTSTSPPEPDSKG